MAHTHTHTHGRCARAQWLAKAPRVDRAALDSGGLTEVVDQTTIRLTYTHTHAHTHTHTHMDAQMSSNAGPIHFTGARAPVRVCEYASIDAYAHVCVCVCVCVDGAPTREGGGSTAHSASNDGDGSAEDRSAWGHGVIDSKGAKGLQNGHTRTRTDTHTWSSTTRRHVCQLHTQW